MFIDNYQVIWEKDDTKDIFMKTDNHELTISS